MTLPQVAPLRVTELSVSVYRAPIAKPVRAAMGTMTNRPAVIVRAEGEGTVGYGEIWCNFPTCGAEHRARLVESLFRDWVLEKSWSSPAQAFAELTRRSHTLALQAGEPGPVAQVIAGIDIALWDLAARQAGVPLWRLLGGTRDRVPAYASGINPDRAEAQGREAQAAGYHAFKLKIGFDSELDLANLAALRAALGDVPIAVDANQAWDLDEAIKMSQALARHGAHWLEEPIPADSPIEDWQRLEEASPIPLAAGENLRGDAAFDEAIASGAFGVIQPDLAKWGGISACLPLAGRIGAASLRYCPHFLGGGIGLMASAHLLAAAGGDGLLEIDCNTNPLREGLASPFPPLEDGHFVLSTAPGLGVAPSPDIERFAIAALA